MIPKQKKAFIDAVNQIDSPFLCDQLIALLEARREQLRPGYDAYKPKKREVKK